MPRPRHSALYWAAHIGGGSALIAVVVGLALVVVGETIGRSIATCGAAGVTLAGALAVAGARRHR